MTPTVTGSANVSRMFSYISLLIVHVLFIFHTFDIHINVVNSGSSNINDERSGFIFYSKKTENHHCLFQ